MPETNNAQGVITQFLINPRLRIVRHLLLLLILSIISFNQTLFTFSRHTELAGNPVYLIGLSTLLLYLILAYVNIYILIPLFLLKRRYTEYVLYLSLTLFLFLIIQILKEYAISEYFHLPPLRSSYFNGVTLLDMLSSFCLNLIALTGIAFTVLIKHWLTDANRASLLEQQQVRQQVEDLKEQINPTLLFKILNRSAALSKFEPDKAMDMLYKLSELLRYQLYDCTREKVLLTSVIRFLENYLALEQLYSGKFTYHLTVQGQTTGIFVEPLIYLPFIQEMISRIYQSEEADKLEITFKTENKTILLTCRAKGIVPPEKKSFSGIRHRLDILYKNDYTLTVSGSEKEKEVYIQFELKPGE